jgi:hypothetical protein
MFPCFFKIFPRQLRCLLNLLSEIGSVIDLNVGTKNATKNTTKNVTKNATKNVTKNATKNATQEPNTTFSLDVYDLR